MIEFSKPLIIKVVINGKLYGQRGTFNQRAIDRVRQALIEERDQGLFRVSQLGEDYAEQTITCVKIRNFVLADRVWRILNEECGCPTCGRT